MANNMPGTKEVPSWSNLSGGLNKHAPGLAEVNNFRWCHLTISSHRHAVTRIPVRSSLPQSVLGCSVPWMLSQTGDRRWKRRQRRQHYSPGKPRLDSGFLIYRFRTKLNVCSSFQVAILASGSFEELAERSWSEIGWADRNVKRCTLNAQSLQSVHITHPRSRWDSTATWLWCKDIF